MGKLSKKRKIIIACTIVGIFSVVMITITAFAEINYDLFPFQVIKHIVKRTWKNDIIRSVSFSVVSFLAQVIDYFETALDSIISFNIMNLFSEITGLTDMAPVAWMAFSIFLILGACGLMLFPEKIKINEFLKGIFTSAALIIALPTFLSSMNTMKRTALYDINQQDISVESQYEYSYTLGDELLSQNLVDLAACGYDYNLNYYAVSDDRSPKSIYNININSVLSNEEGAWDKEVVDINSPQTTQKKYSELTYENMAELLDIGHEYRLLKDSQAKVPFGEETNINYLIVVSVTTGVNQSGQPQYDERHYTIRSYEKKLIVDLSYRTDVISYGLHSAVFSSPDIEAAFNCINSTVIKDLNTINNQRIAASNSEYSADYSYDKLMTQDEYDDLGLGETISQLWETGSDAESIYRYDFDFWFIFIFLICVALSLFFSALKCGTMMFEMVFVQIIAPVVIATDLHNSGRAKQVFKNLLSSYLMFIIVCLLLKIYIWSILYIHNTLDNYIVEIILTVCFAKGVIDGPDFITKIMGMDSGMRSGVGMLMQMSSMAYPTSMALRSVTSTAHMAFNAGGKAFRAGSAAVGSVAGAAAGLAKGGVEGAFKSVSDTAGNGSGIGGKILHGAEGAVKGAAAGFAKGAVHGGETGYHTAQQLGSGHPIEAGKTVYSSFKDSFSGGKRSENTNGSVRGSSNETGSSNESININENSQTSGKHNNSATEVHEGHVLNSGGTSYAAPDIPTSTGNSNLAHTFRNNSDRTSPPDKNIGKKE